MEDIVLVPGRLSRWLRLPNGARVHYMASGETGPPIILLHGGLTGSSGIAGWRFMAPFLGANGGGYGREELETAGAYRVYDDPLDLLDHIEEVGVRP